MIKQNIMSKKQQYFAIFASVIVSLLVVYAAASGATTISTDISTGGNLTVTGNSDLTGTLEVTGASTLTGNTAVVGTLTVTGATRLNGGLGLGAANAINKTILLSPLDADPAASEGLIYYKSSEDVLRMSDGTNWWTVGTSTSGWTLTGTRIHLATEGTHYLTLGTTTASTNMLIVEATSTATVPLTIRGFGDALAQTANLLQVQNSSSGELFAVDALGHASGSQMTLSSNLWGNSAIFTASSTVDSTLTVTGNAAFNGGTFIFNNAGADKDFRAEGDSEANLLMLDASSDRVGVATATPGVLLAVQGNIMSDGDLNIGDVRATGTISVGTSTPGGGEIVAENAATSTLYLSSSTAAIGGCIQLSGATSTAVYRIYIGERGDGSTLIIEEGPCEG